MKSFKTYQPTPTSSEASPLSAEELTRRLTSAYEGKTDAEMLRSILAEAEKSKRAGTLTNEDLETFYQSFSPMLNAFQNEVLREIIHRLKEI